MKIGRRIALDYGDIRIGVAMSDPHGILASPLTVLLREDPSLAQKIQSLIAEHEPISILGTVNLSGLRGRALAK